MLDTVFDLFARRDPRRNAVVGLARILNRHDIAEMVFQSGAGVDRRESSQRRVSWGVWLFPINPSMKADELQLNRGLPAITHDLRRKGIGVMTPLHLDGEQFVVAVPEDPVLDAYAPERTGTESFWTFFRCDVRHNTRCPGGWYQIGLQVAELLTLDGDQRKAFRAHIASIAREVDL